MSESAGMVHPMYPFCKFLLAIGTIGYTIGFTLLNGLIAYLAFSATTLIVHNGFELKPKRLTLINNAYQLVLFVAMALVIGVFGA